MNERSTISEQTSERGRAIDQTLDALFRNHGNKVFDYGIVQNYPEKSVIFHQDTLSHAVYLIEKGLVKLVRFLETGQPIIVGIRRRHWLIGAPSALLDRMCLYTAITLVPSSLRCIAKTDFQNLVKTEDYFSWYVHLLLSQEIIRQLNSAEARNCLTAKQRMKHLLRDMIEDQQLNGTVPSGFSLPLTSKEISQLLAITPEHLCRILKELKQEGLIRHEKGILTVTAPASLL